ncbi:hypothetical protein F3Y22_tig00116989pilonHSYRG00572 [Hibiscus syriacus]|uniref:Protein kinase domain-containing protein n=1 Tax=Hibiscus syriacus TaxID=106335 RepID=A0A6A2WGH1_HIBSY|nr:hypothetical protein F3Y22_tig00116989pilonHSYRG00572 [Hibiscus syriacus]
MEGKIAQLEENMMRLQRELEEKISQNNQSTLDTITKIQESLVDHIVAKLSGLYQSVLGAGSPDGIAVPPTSQMVISPGTLLGLQGESSATKEKTPFATKIQTNISNPENMGESIGLTNPVGDSRNNHKKGKIEEGEASKKPHMKKRDEEINNVNTYNTSKGVTISNPKIIAVVPSGTSRQDSREHRKEREHFNHIPMSYKEIYQKRFDTHVVSPYPVEPMKPLYPRCFSDISSATNNFLYQPFSSSLSSSSWRCHLQDKQVVVFQRKLRRPVELDDLVLNLSLIELTLAIVLRNPKNPSFTSLSSWICRMQIAIDVAHGLDYIHHCSGLETSFTHNHIKMTSILVAQDSLRAKICHFGTAEICGEVIQKGSKGLGRTDSKVMKIEGTRGYVAPELQFSGLVMQKCDVYAFGVVGEGGGAGLRRWVDRRLKDSFSVEVVEKMVVAAIEFLEEDPGKTPEMSKVVGKVSKLYLESKTWADNIGLPTSISVSMAPR